VSAAEAYFLGIADRLVEVAPETEEQAREWEGLDEAARGRAMLALARRTVLSEAVGLAGEVCEGGPVAVRAALRAVGEPGEAMEASMYQRVVATEDRDEALRAFAGKRKPVFKGR
jgi:methylglutaconyl-CoA hydratase